MTIARYPKREDSNFKAFLFEIARQGDVIHAKIDDVRRKVNKNFFSSKFVQIFVKISFKKEQDYLKSTRISPVNNSRQLVLIMLIVSYKRRKSFQTENAFGAPVKVSQIHSSSAHG